MSTSEHRIITDKCHRSPVLFLDIDWTLGPGTDRYMHDGFTPWPETIAGLDALLTHCDAQIVVSSGRIGQEDICLALAKILPSHHRHRLSGQCASAKEVMDTKGMTPKEAMVVNWLEAAEAEVVYPSYWAIYDDDIRNDPAPWSLRGRIVTSCRGPMTADEYWHLWSKLSGRLPRIGRKERGDSWDRLRAPRATEEGTP